MREGIGAGSQRRSGSSASCPSGAVSNSTVTMSTPEMPSTRAWWVLQTSAKRPPSTPSTTQISHSGLSRSSCCASTRPGEGAELLLGARRRERGLADVVAQVQVRVVHPARPALPERHERELLAIARDEMQPALDAPR